MESVSDCPEEQHGNALISSGSRVTYCLIANSQTSYLDPPCSIHPWILGMATESVAGTLRALLTSRAASGSLSGHSKGLHLGLTASLMRVGTWHDSACSLGFACTLRPWVPMPGAPGGLKEKVKPCVWDALTSCNWRPPLYIFIRLRAASQRSQLRNQLCLKASTAVSTVRLA